MNEIEFRRELAGAISDLQGRPAHKTQSAEESSLDAWLEGDHYYWRPERSISYYIKGELLGVLLDLAVRENSHGRASLREVFQWMNQNYARTSLGFPESDGVRRAAEAVGGGDLHSFFDHYVAGTEEIPWNDFLRTVALQLDEVKRNVPDAGFSVARNFDGPQRVGSVTVGGPAEHAGLHQGDLIVSFNGKNTDNLAAELSALKPGDGIVLQVRNPRGQTTELKWDVGSHEETSYAVNDVANPTRAQLARRAAWLQGEAESGALAK